MEIMKVNLKYIFLMGIILFLSLLMTDISFAERGYGLDEFDDRLDEFDDLELELLVESLDSLKKIPAKKINKGQGPFLSDDNIYLLDDDFDLGEDELELQKLDVFSEDSTQVGTSSNLLISPSATFILLRNCSFASSHTYSSTVFILFSF